MNGARILFRFFDYKRNSVGSAFYHIRWAFRAELFGAARAIGEKI
jgi:hypothetical protein